MKYFAGEGGVGTPDSLYVIPIAMIFMCLGMPMSAFFQARMGLPLSMLFGSLLMSTGVFLSSYATTLSQFILPYCVLFGTGTTARGAKRRAETVRLRDIDVCLQDFRTQCRCC